MKKTIAKTAALIMAAMLAGTAIVPVTVSSYRTSSTTSDESQVEMKKALTIVKKRIDIPKELTEFDYSTSENYGTRTFSFNWRTPDNAKQPRRIMVIITGEIITEYYDSKNDSRYYDIPTFAKLSEQQLLSKAEGYIKQINPDIADSAKLELNYMGLFSDEAEIWYERYENGIPVRDNYGYMNINKNTGALSYYEANWWGNAEFADPNGAKSEEEIQEAYRKLCNLTPYYKIYTEYKYNENTGKGEWNKKAAIVYDSDMHSEIDAFTGKESTIWDDMRKAEGTHYYGHGTTEDAVAEAGCEEDEAVEEEVEFTPAELKKIEQDESLIKTDEAFEMLKKDKFVALTDDYKLSSYNVNSYETDEEKKEETFYLSLKYSVKDELKDKYKGYKNISVRMNGETGEIINFNKYGISADLPKLDVTKANKLATEAAKNYSEDIFSGYKADGSNTAPVESWKSGDKTYYEDERTFIFNRYVNNIRVSGDSIRAAVDSNGVVTRYEVSHTDDVVFPSAANILSEDEAFDKVYEQMDFEYYYDGWITKDGKVKTYLIYRMNDFYVNAKTGKICNWDGTEKKSRVYAEDVKYSDIKGIKQEKAILELQKYGIVLTTESRFRPTELISENDFTNLMTNVLGGYVAVEEEDIEEGKESSAEAEAKKKDKAETTMREAAVMFGKLYLPSDIAEMKIFKSPFSDVKDTDEDAGYLAVANEKNFVTGTNGKLGGNNTITRAEAVQIMYDYVRMLTK